jgi:hypothetical protein
MYVQADVTPDEIGRFEAGDPDSHDYARRGMGD